MVRAVIEDWNITTLTDTKIKMTAKNPTKETQWIDIPKENTLQKKGHTAMTQKTAMMTDTSKGLVQDHLTIAIDHINLIPKNIGTIENVLEASREWVDMKGRIIGMIVIDTKKKIDIESPTEMVMIDIESRINIEAIGGNALIKDQVKEETMKKIEEKNTDSQKSLIEPKIKGTTKKLKDTRTTGTLIQLIDMRSTPEKDQTNTKIIEESQIIEERNIRTERR